MKNPLKHKRPQARPTNPVGKRRPLRGVQHVDTGKFLPYPLPIDNLEISDEDFYEVELSVKRDDKSAWEQGGGRTPLLFEFRLRCYVMDVDAGPGQYLLTRAAELNVDPSELPERTTLPVTDDEREAILNAKIAAREALFCAALRWSGLEEVGAPNGIKVPTKVPVGTEYLVADKHGLVEIAWAISQPGARARARRRLRGEDRKAFDVYCEYWDQQHGRAS